MLAAPGIIALQDHVEKLPRDHSNAKALARGLAFIPGVTVENGIASVETNILFINLDPVSAAARLHPAVSGSTCRRACPCPQVCFLLLFFVFVLLVFLLPCVWLRVCT